MNYEKLDNMGRWERHKALFIISEAEKLRFDTENAQIGVNENSGYVWLWSENEQFSLYMPISCDLVKSDIVAMYTDLNNGEEFEQDLKLNTTIRDLNEWVEELQKSEED